MFFFCKSYRSVISLETKGKTVGLDAKQVAALNQIRDTGELFDCIEKQPIERKDFAKMQKYKVVCTKGLNAGFFPYKGYFCRTYTSPGTSIY